MRKKLMATAAAATIALGAGVSLGACEVENPNQSDNGVAKGLGSKDATKDVTLGEMEVGEFDDVVIPATVKNPTDKASDYMIEATLYDSKGVNIGTAMGFLSRVAPKGTGKVELIGVGQPTSYKLSVVERTASHN